MLTLAIIKPDALQAGHTGKILALLEGQGFRIRAARLVRLSQAQAEAFYAVHRERPFLRPLVAFMTSGPALALALERDNAVGHLRDVIGATDPADAKAGTQALRPVQGAKRHPRVRFGRERRAGGGVFLPRERVGGTVLTQVPQGFSFAVHVAR